MVPVMAVPFGNTHSVLHSSSSPRTWHFSLHSKTANNCHKNFCGFKLGKIINGAAVQSLMVVKCTSTLGQPEQISSPLTAVSEIPTESARLSSRTHQVWNPITATRDQQGRFRSPRAARELALLILYEACVEGSDPLRLLERRVNMRYAGSKPLDKTSLEYYDHMHFSGSPLIAETKEQARVLEMKQEEETSKEAEVLAAPLKLVYNTFVLSMTKKILEAVTRRWDQHIGILEEIIPKKWKDDSAGRILELCLLHMAMSEIVVLGTRHQVVINEVIDLAKRFCDGGAPRVINGCLRNFVKKENL